MLTDTGIRAFPVPSKGQKLYFDSAVPNFACRVSQGGTKTFVVLIGRDRRFITVGRYPVIALSDARAQARRILAEHTLGKSRPKSISFDEAVELFLSDKAQSRRPSTVRSYRDKLKRLGFKCRLADISPTEAARRIEKITASSERSHVLIAGKVFFNWCIKRRYLTENPLFGVSKPGRPSRDRVLTSEEIRALWAPEGPFADYCKLLLLTGQRRGELRHAVLDHHTFSIPAAVAKNHRENVVPLTDLARFYFREFPDFDWSRQKKRLDEKTGLSGWTLQDLRRTFATGLADLDVAPHIIERILNHVTGVISGVSAVYNRSRYMPQMRDALERWEAHLRSLTAMQHAA